MHTITSSATIEKLQLIFATHGLPHTIVVARLSVQNSRISVVLMAFDTSNQHHIHPATNSLAEKAVQSFKQGLTKSTKETLQSRLSQYLFHYRITPHTTTGLSPAEMLMGRRPRSLLDLLHPDSAERMESRQSFPGQGTRSFEVGDNVFALDFRSKKVKWMPGEVVKEVVKVTGPLSCQVKDESGVIRRHIYALRKHYSARLPSLQSPLQLHLNR